MPTPLPAANAPSADHPPPAAGDLSRGPARATGRWPAALTPGGWRGAWQGALVLAVLLVLGFTAVHGIRTAAAQSAAAEDAQRALTLLAELRLGVGAAEAGLRAFALTANPAALEPLQQAGPQVQAQLDALRQLGASEPEQFSRLLALAPLITQRLEALARTADLRNRPAAAPGALPLAVAAWELSDDNRRTGDRVQTALAAIQQHAEKSLAAARERRDAAAGWAWQVTLISVLASAGAALFAGLRQRATAAQLGRHLRQHRSSDDSQRRTAQTLERLVSSSLAPIVLIDAEGRVVRANPAALRLWGGPPAALIGTALVTHTLAEDQRRTERALAQAASAPQTLQHRCRRADGQPLHLAWSLQAAGDDGNLIAVATDLSEAQALTQTVARQLQALEAAAAARADADSRATDAERRLKELLGTLGRCLKAPLAALEQQARNAQAGLADAADAAGAAPPPAAAARAWAAVLERSLALQRLVADVLDLGRIHAGQLPLKREAFDLWESVNGVAGTVRAVADRKGLTLQLQLADDLGYGHGDTQRVEQALEAVLRDAVDVAAAGTLTLAARRLPGGQVRFDVQHPRPAGEARDLEGLLAPLHDADLPCTPERTAHLLGLAMARGLARCMGGDLTAAWPSPDQAVLTLTLPADEMPGR